MLGATLPITYSIEAAVAVLKTNHLKKDIERVPFVIKLSIILASI